MDPIGEELRKARELRGMSLRDVEEATKIRMKYLIALEADDFEALPGRVYVIGFLRNYARFLRIDDEELVNRFKLLSHSEANKDEPIEKPKRPKKHTKGFSPIVLIIVLIFLIVFVFMLYHNRLGSNSSPNHNQTPQSQNSNQGQNTKTPEANESTPRENQDNSTTNPGTVNPTNPDTDTNVTGVSVTVIVKEAECWLDVNIDGVDNFKGTLAAGENRTFVGKEKIKIKYGNAGAVEVIYNGKTIYPLGNSGQVLTQEYTEE